MLIHASMGINPKSPRPQPHLPINLVLTPFQQTGNIWLFSPCVLSLRVNQSQRTRPLKNSSVECLLGFYPMVQQCHCICMPLHPHPPRRGRHHHNGIQIEHLHYSGCLVSFCRVRNNLPARDVVACRNRWLWLSWWSHKKPVVFCIYRIHMGLWFPRFVVHGCPCIPIGPGLGKRFPNWKTVNSQLMSGKKDNMAWLFLKCCETTKKHIKKFQSVD